MSIEKTKQQSEILSDGETRFGNQDPTMRLNKLAALLDITEVDLNHSTWVSSTKNPESSNEESGAKVSIGKNSVPADVAKLWNWEVDENKQLLLKVAHEFAHKFQHDKGHEQALVRALSTGQIEDNDEEYIPYISLYIALEESGSVSGLSSDPFYKEQSKSTGKVKMEVLEDITELIAAYLISDKYLIHKLDTSVSNLTYEQAQQIAILVARVCKDLS